MKSYRLSELGDAELRSLIARPRIDFSSVFSLVCPSPSLHYFPLFHCHSQSLTLLFAGQPHSWPCSTKRRCCCQRVSSYFFVLSSFHSPLSLSLRSFSTSQFFPYFCRYTLKFDNVQLDDIVHLVADLPDPLVFIFCLFVSPFRYLFWSIQFIQFWLSALHCSLMRMLRKLSISPTAIYMPFMLLRGLLKQMLRTSKYDKILLLTYSRFISGHWCGFFSETSFWVASGRIILPVESSSSNNIKYLLLTLLHLIELVIII